MSRRFVRAMAARELRGSRRRLLLYGTCMALGIAALVALGGLRSAIATAVSARARTLMGADLMLRAQAPFGERVHAEIETLTGGDPSAHAEVTSFGSMALALRSGRTRLVHVQAVEPGFPFYGEVVTEPARQWPRLWQGAFAIVDPAVLVQLDARVGDLLQVGRARFTILAEARRAPGSLGLRASVAPRVFLPASQLEATGLVQRGSLVEYLAYLRVPGAPARLDGWVEAHRPLLEAQRTTARTVRSYQEDLSESFATLTRYLGLVGLAALLLGGLGVAAGIRVFVQERLETAAVLRALGARSGEVMRVYLVQAALLGLLAGVVGVVLGTGVQLLLPRVLAAVLPVALAFRPDPGMAALGIALGVGVSLAFAGWPLAELRTTPPLRALRRDVEAPQRARSMPRPRAALAPMALAAMLLAAALWQAPSLRVGLFFAAGLALTLLLLAGAARLLSLLLRRHLPRHAPYWLRQGIASLFRPRNQTLSATLTLGFGLFLVASVQLLQTNLLTELAIDSRPDRPNLVLFDVQRDQRDAVTRLLEERGVALHDVAPLVPARLAALRGQPVTATLAQRGTHPAETRAERDARWALRREYRLTYRGELRDTERIVAGELGTATSPGAPPAISLEREMAELLGVGLGDRIRWNIQGVDLETVVGSLREVDWGRYATNFVVVFPPGVLEQAPQSLVLLGYLAGAETRAALQRDLVTRFPNVSVLDATALLRAVDAIVGQVSLAVRFMAGFTLATGLVVLLAAASTARFQRTREALLLRTLGARAGTLRRILTTESLVLGALAASVGLGLATLGSWALVHFVFEHAFHVPVGVLGILWLSTVALAGALGASHAGPALRQPPLAGLREVEGAGS